MNAPLTPTMATAAALETPPSDDELMTALRQYRDDLTYPVAPDSRERRIAMIDALIGRLSA